MGQVSLACSLSLHLCSELIKKKTVRCAVQVHPCSCSSWPASTKLGVAPGPIIRRPPTRSPPRLAGAPPYSPKTASSPANKIKKKEKAKQKPSRPEPEAIQARRPRPHATLHYTSTRAPPINNTGARGACCPPTTPPGLVLPSTHPAGRLQCHCQASYAAASPAAPIRRTNNNGAAAVGVDASARLRRRQAWEGRRRRRRCRRRAAGGPDGHGGAAGRVAVPGRAAAAAAAAGVRLPRWPARDGAPGAPPRRPPPRLRGVRRAQGGRALQDRLLPRLLRLAPRQPPRLTGSGGGAGRVHGGVRPGRVRRERPEPCPVRAERGAGHGGASRRAGPRRQVLRRGGLPGLPRRVGRAPAHPAPAGGRRHAGARGQLLVAGAPRGGLGGGVRAAGAGGPVGAARVAPRAGAAPLVDASGVAAHLHRRRQHHAPPQQARRRDPRRARRRRHAAEEAGRRHAAGHPRVLLQGHDGDVRQVGVRPHGAAGAAVPRPPVAGRRGRPRPGRPAAPRRWQPPVGELPRAPRHRTLPVRRPRTRGHRSPDTLRLVSRRKAVVASTNEVQKRGLAC